MDVDVFEAKCMADDDEVIVGKKSIRPQPMPDEKGILFQKPVQKIKSFFKRYSLRTGPFYQPLSNIEASKRFRFFWDFSV